MTSEHYLQEMKRVKAFVFDVDGVLTDGSLLLTEKGELLRTMNIRDGYAMQLAVKKGYKVCIISGGKSQGVVARLNGLGLTQVYIGIDDKKEKLENFLLLEELKATDVLYMGDDMPDMEVMGMVGFPCCPKDAAPEIVSISKYVSPYTGGQGCVRDVMEKVLKLNNHWE